eukprot:TRINITY_DN18398_c0_g1_i1.p1 TRINITY_DN18398_c0_g1~~TRINITY_DN18398_c0_g1_i1.p1  ORF type:complete len:507 (+),score=133.36 TRINITY_DN18398_c0_g1_i1:46-1521(+)
MSLQELLDFDETDEEIKKELLQIVAQHLAEEGYVTTAHTLRAEASLHDAREGRKVHSRGLMAQILEGDWDEVHRSLGRSGLKGFKAFLYAVARQQFLEQIESGDGHKAFATLRKRLKPLESEAPPGEFNALTYLLSCKAVHDAPGNFFKDWREESGRQKLVTRFKHLIEPHQTPTLGTVNVSSGRLWTLVKQACGYQVMSQPKCPFEKPNFTSLTADYQAPICPNLEKCVLWTNTSVKCCGWQGDKLAAGGGDGTLHVWDLEGIDEAGDINPRPTSFTGHKGRIWSVSPLSSSRFLSSGADGTVKIWDLSASTSNQACLSTLANLERDIYTINQHPDGVHFAFGGVDCAVRLYDAETLKEMQIYLGHTRPITSVGFNHFGNIVITGSKDGTVRLYDIASAACLQTIDRVQTGAAVSSVDLSRDGKTLLVGYQDSSIRMWDLATGSIPLLTPMRLQGHVNTSRNLIKSSFGPGNLVFSGSEDGSLCIWSSQQ